MWLSYNGISSEWEGSDLQMKPVFILQWPATKHSVLNAKYEGKEKCSVGNRYPFPIAAEAFLEIALTIFSKYAEFVP